MADHITFSLELADVTRHHMAFLQAVWERTDLFEKGQTLKHTLPRYRDMWLPVVASQPDDVDLEPPLDIHWLWYLHMLRHNDYHGYCQKQRGKVPSHRFLFLAESRESAKERTRNLWDARYPHEPFDEVNALYKNVPDEDGADDDDNDEALQYLLSDMDQQKRFIYQILLPHFIDPQFLASAIHRYKMYLISRKSHPGSDLAPVEVGYDVELIHRSHLSRPQAYRRDITAIFGMVPEFGTPETVSNSQALLNLISINGLGRIPGAIFRGEPMFNKLNPLTAQDKFKMSHKGCKLGLKKLRVENLNHRHIALVIGIARWSDLDMTSKEFISTGRPPFEWTPKEATQPYLVELEWKSEGYEQLYVSAFQRKFGKTDRSRALVGALFDKQLVEYLESMEVPLEDSVQSFSRNAITARIDCRFNIGVNVYDVKTLSVELSLKPGEFEKRVIPENLKDVWGPLMLEGLPEGVINDCTFALHKFVNHREEDALTCRIIHSLPLRMSAVEVMSNDKMTAVAHLVGSETFPMPSQVREDFPWPTLDPTKGERGMLIKTAEGDWGAAIARWKADPIEPGNPAKGTFYLRVYDLKRHRQGAIDISMAALRKNYVPIDLLGMDIDFKNQKIKVPADTEDVTEFVALGMSVVVLFVLCGPQPDDSPKKGVICACLHRDRTAKQVPIFMAGGYGQELPSNEWVKSNRITTAGGKLERCESTAWREVQGKSKTLMMYLWKRPDGFTDSRQASFDLDEPPRGNNKNSKEEY